MIKKVCKTAATLRVRVAINDGLPVWRETPCMVAEADYTRRDVDNFGTLTNGKIFILAPPISPVMPAQIVIHGRTYDIKAVKVCRTLGGVLTGCRLAVV